MSADKQLIKHMLDCLRSPNRELTQWEDTFVASLREQFEESERLSERQVEILERIYAEKTT